MESFIRENTWLTSRACGWGNGYVLIPTTSKLHGVNYNLLNDLEQIFVHGGLTFSELVDVEMCESWGLKDDSIGMWCVGFDTAHYGDDKTRWTEERVQKEADNLLSQLQSI